MTAQDETRRRINRFGLKIGALVIGISAFTIVAIPPFYDWFCRVTGFSGTPLRAEANTAEPIDQTIAVRFNASTYGDMPWVFEPVERRVELLIGESGLAYYEAHNPTNRPIAGTASFSVQPYAADGYFVKVECFCFTEQVLEPGETVRLPVSFYVDPAIVDDSEGRFVREITLSYTFFETELPEDYDRQAALTDPADPGTQTN